MRGHASHVNACDVAPGFAPLVVTGSDDGSCKLWDLRRRGAAATVRGKHAVCAVAFGPDASSFSRGASTRWFGDGTRGCSAATRATRATRARAPARASELRGPLGHDHGPRPCSRPTRHISCPTGWTASCAGGTCGRLRGERRCVGEFGGATHDPRSGCSGARGAGTARGSARGARVATCTCGTRRRGRSRTSSRGTRARWWTWRSARASRRRVGGGGQEGLPGRTRRLIVVFDEGDRGRRNERTRERRVPRGGVYDTGRANNRDDAIARDVRRFSEPSERLRVRNFGARRDASEAFCFFTFV